MIDEQTIKEYAPFSHKLGDEIPLSEAAIIDEHLMKFRQWGLNPDNVRVRHFDQAYVLLTDPYTEQKLRKIQALFQHKKTRKVATTFLFIPGVSQYPLAGALIEAAT